MDESKSQLLLVNIYNRHADRSPGEGWFPGDPHEADLNKFWPFGLHNLVPLGKFRSQKIGYKLRDIYNGFLGFDSSELLAFSSFSPRCVETIELIIEALYDISTTQSNGVELAKLATKLENGHDGEQASSLPQSAVLPSGPGWCNEHKKVSVDIEAVSGLTFLYLFSSPYFKDQVRAIEENPLLDEDIKRVPGIERLIEVFKQKYKLEQNCKTNFLWSTLMAELTIQRTSNTLAHTRIYADWINEVVATRGSNSATLLDVYCYLVLSMGLRRFDATSQYLLAGNSITSMVESQLVALGEQPTSDLMKSYSGKRMILYGTHDVTMHLIMSNLNLIANQHGDQGPFEDRFFGAIEQCAKTHVAGNNLELCKLLAGVGACSYGCSLKFELRQIERSPTDKFAFVQASIYNQDDAKTSEVRYVPLELGLACRKLFERQAHPNRSVAEFYPKDIHLSDLSCPFELFRLVTEHLMTKQDDMDQLSGHSNTSQQRIRELAREAMAEYKTDKPLTKLR